MTSNPARLAAVVGTLVLLVIAAIVYVIVSSANDTPPAPAAAPTSSSPAPQPSPEPSQAPTFEPSPEPSTPADPERFAYEKSTRWGSVDVPPPELTPEQQVFADVACNFASAQYDFDPTEVSDYDQILPRSKPFADPALFEQITADVEEYGSIGDYDLWVREGATTSVVCASAPFGKEPMKVTTLGGLEVDAWPMYTRTRVRMELPDAPTEQTYPTFVLYVAELPGVQDPRVVLVEVEHGEH